jgi:hypothetical protein
MTNDEIKVFEVLAKLDRKLVYSCTVHGAGLTHTDSRDACHKEKTRIVQSVEWRYYVLCCEEHVEYWKALSPSIIEVKS